MEAPDESVTLTGHGGEPVPAEIFRPAGAQPVRGGVVVVHEVFGLDASTRSVARKLADEGYVAIAPDLYRSDLPGPASTVEDPAPAWTTEQIRAAVRGLPDRRAVGDLEGALGRLREEEGIDPDHIGAIGFCMGGNLAFLLGCASRWISAVVDFYGRIVYDELSAEKPVQPLEMSLGLTAPLLGIFAGDDPSIPQEHVRELEDRLSAFAKPFEIRMVPGVGHGFFNPLRPAWNEAEAREAWNKTLSFLNENLA